MDVHNHLRSQLQNIQEVFAFLCILPATGFCESLSPALPLPTMEPHMYIMYVYIYIYIYIQINACVRVFVSGALPPPHKKKEHKAALMLETTQTNVTNPKPTPTPPPPPREAWGLRPLALPSVSAAGRHAEHQALLKLLGAAFGGAAPKRRTSRHPSAGFGVGARCFKDIFPALHMFCPRCFTGVARRCPGFCLCFPGYLWCATIATMMVENDARRKTP